MTGHAVDVHECLASKEFRDGSSSHMGVLLRDKGRCAGQESRKDNGDFHGGCACWWCFLILLAENMAVASSSLGRGGPNLAEVSEICP